MNDVYPKLSVWGYLWALPTTIFGLLVALLTGCLRMRAVEGVLEVDAGRAVATLGWVIRALAWVGQKITRREMDAVCPSAFTLGHMIFSEDTNAREYWRPHERVHVRQNEKWGPFWLPAYLASSLWALVRGKDPYYDNAFEIEAYNFWPGD